MRTAVDWGRAKKAMGVLGDVCASLLVSCRMASPRRPRFSADLSQCLFDFVIQLLPPPDELHVKENVRRLLQRLIRNIQPNCRLLAFGSTANGFSLRNSGMVSVFLLLPRSPPPDMDLCCLIDSPERLNPADLVTILGDLLERGPSLSSLSLLLLLTPPLETRFHVKPLPHARIPIVKLSLDPSPGLPSGIACDIGFENRLAIENTRLLLTYAKIDPTRVRTLVLFRKSLPLPPPSLLILPPVKIWSKRRFALFSSLPLPHPHSLLEKSILPTKALFPPTATSSS